MQKISASMAVSKHRICSISLSRKAFNLESTVEITDFIAWSEVVSAEPASILALWFSGSLSMRS